MSTSFRFQLMFSLIFTTSLHLPLTITTKPRQVVTRLIHRDSIFSPFYNPNDTIADHAKRILSNSNARFAYLQSEVQKTLATSNAQAHLLADKHAFLVQFSIGQPPVPQLAIMDTGSTLTWIQCQPCKTCYKQKSRMFDSSNSSTYDNLSCWDDSCEASSSGHTIHFFCNYSDNNCMYSLRYVDDATSKGYIATEQLIFETFDDDTTVIQDVAFGCGQENTEKLHGQWNGVFGLGSSPISIVNKLGGKFAYCIDKITNHEYGFNRLALGDGVPLEGYSTPFEIDKGHYYITLEGISVGEESLNIDGDMFKKTLKGGGVILDSGSELTYLPEVAYSIVREKVSSILYGFLPQSVYGIEKTELCYYGIVTRDLRGFPVLTFHLAGGADLVLDAESLFYHRKENMFCLAMVPVTSKPNGYLKHSVIGMWAQQSYNVAYELNQEKIYFQKMDCELLDD